MSREYRSQHSMRPRREEPEDAEVFVSSGSKGDDLNTAEAEESDLEESSNDTDVSARSGDMSDGSSSADTDSSSAIKDISFGALAKAQESVAPPSRPGKRKADLVSDHDHPRPLKRDDFDPRRPSKSSKSSHPSRTSKHAPQTLSTRHAVSRKRIIFSPPASLQSRDPRFDPAIMATPRHSLPLDMDKANENYSFLTSYRQSELQALQTQLKAAQSRHVGNPAKPVGTGPDPVPASSAVDAEQIGRLKRQIQSLGSKVASSTARKREAELRRAHKQREREAIRDGRKTQPYYLKKGEVRKEVERERVESMGKRARDKKELRKRKREKGKEGRGLPRVRREVAAGNR